MTLKKTNKHGANCGKSPESPESPEMGFVEGESGKSGNTIGISGLTDFGIGDWRLAIGRR